VRDTNIHILFLYAAVNLRFCAPWIHGTKENQSHYSCCTSYCMVKMELPLIVLRIPPTLALQH